MRASRLECVLRVLLLTGVACAWTSMAAANPVVLVSDDRSGYDVGQPCWEDFETGYTCGDAYSYHYEPPVDFADWNGGGQSTHVEPLAMNGYGSGSAFSDYGWNEANTSFDITFEVVSPVEIELTGSLEAGGGWGGGEAYARLFENGEQIFSAWAMDSYEDILFADILLPGTYRIHIYTQAYPISDAWFDFALNMTPTTVPEPGSALLVGVGLLLAAGRRRR